MVELKCQLLVWSDERLDLAAAIDILALGALEQCSDGDHGENDAAGAENKEELAALAVDEHHADGGEAEVEGREEDVSPMCLEVREPALEKDVGVESDDRIDAGGGVAGEDDAGEQEGDDVFAAK